VVNPDGLSSREADLRRRRGEGNRVGDGVARSSARIWRTHVFNLYNGILFSIGGTFLGSLPGCITWPPGFG